MILPEFKGLKKIALAKVGFSVPRPTGLHVTKSIFGVRPRTF